MEDKKKNDIATKPLNAGQRVAARGVLCGDPAVYRNLQCEVLAAVKTIYRVED
jgi:hypothetical protein